MSIADHEGLIDLLNEVSSMLANDPRSAGNIKGFRLAMPDELRGFALMLSYYEGDTSG